MEREWKNLEFGWHLNKAEAGPQTGLFLFFGVFFFNFLSQHNISVVQDPGVFFHESMVFLAPLMINYDLTLYFYLTLWFALAFRKWILSLLIFCYEHGIYTIADLPSCFLENLLISLLFPYQVFWQILRVHYNNNKSW